jgi:PHP family Zn ribbon phosphoesterase
MKQYHADLHIHSVLSPCGDLGMSPVNIIRKAKRRNIDILAITDHNATHHCRLIKNLGDEEGIVIIPGAEVNTREEIHCLTLFETIEAAETFQHFLDQRLPFVQNDPDRFGDQVVVDREEQILEEIEPLLISALDADIYEVREEVRKLGGLFIPAHIDRPYNSILSQLGFVPDDLMPDALEVSKRNTRSEFSKAHLEISAYPLITSSDAHTLDALGSAITEFELKYPEFSELKMAFSGTGGRNIIMG